MEVTALGIPAGLQTPCGKGGIQEGIDTIKSGLNTDGTAVSHVQLHDDVAALDQIQLLSYDITVAVGQILLTETLQQKAFSIVKNAEA